MTWSIIARDNQGHFGVAIASKFFAVGALCVHTRRGVGAVATQALMNPLYGPAGLDALAHGLAPSAVVAQLIAADAGRDPSAIEISFGDADVLGEDPAGAVERLAAAGVDRVIVPSFLFLNDPAASLADFGERVIAPNV